MEYTLLENPFLLPFALKILFLKQLLIRNNILLNKWLFWNIFLWLITLFHNNLLWFNTQNMKRVWTKMGFCSLKLFWICFWLWNLDELLDFWLHRCDFEQEPEQATFWYLTMLIDFSTISWCLRIFFLFFIFFLYLALLYLIFSFSSILIRASWSHILDFPFWLLKLDLSFEMDFVSWVSWFYTTTCEVDCTFKGTKIYLFFTVQEVLFEWPIVSSSLSMGSYQKWLAHGLT